MAKLTKKQKEAKAKIEAGVSHDVLQASTLVKEITNVNFDASVDLAVRLGVDPRKANQMVRGVVTLPNGTGKEVKVLALVTPDKEAEAKEAGADYVSFGPVGTSTLGDGSRATRDLFAWWSEMIEVPVVAEGHLDAGLVEELAPVTDFLAVGEEIWREEDAVGALGRLLVSLG